MRLPVAFALTAMLAAGLPTAAQTPAPDAPTDDDVVKLSTTLIQVDAVVTDRDGKPVSGLTASDFEVLQDGHAQPITSVNYVENPTERVANGTVGGGASRAGTAPPASVSGARPGDVRRTIAIVVDDLHLSFENVPNIRRAVREFLANQVRPGDMVAIIRTSGGVGSLQQFTNDRRVLDAAVERLRWSPNSVFGPSSFESTPLDPAALRERGSSATDAARNESRVRTPADLDAGVGGEIRDQRTRAFAGGTLGTLSFILQGMGTFPGRKSLVLFSEGWPSMIDLPGSTTGSKSFKGSATKVPDLSIAEKLKRVTDLASRGSVTIFTADARGFVNPAFADSAISSAEIASNKYDVLWDTSAALRELASATGGTFSSSNDMERQLERAVDGLRGYYLIAYTPDTSTFESVGDDAPRFHSIDVRVKRPGLTVRSRSGFFGVTDEENAARRSTVDRMTEAVTSPFAANDVRLRVTPQFLSDEQKAGNVRAYLHVDARDLSFADAGGGNVSAPVNVLAVLFGDNGRPVSRAAASQTIVVKASDLERVKQRGVVYTLNLPIEKSGVYQLRTAVRDASADRYGSAQQVVEVPDLDRHRLALSGVVLAADGGATAEGGEASGVAEPTGAAVRRFAPGAALGYAFAIYNAPAPSGHATPELDLAVALWRDGERVFQGPPQPMRLKAQQSWDRIYTAGNMKLSGKMKPGEYVLQVTVVDRDASAKDKKKGLDGSTQWIDFEVVDAAPAH